MRACPGLCMYSFALTFHSHASCLGHRSVLSSWLMWPVGLDYDHRGISQPHCWFGCWIAGLGIFELLGWVRIQAVNGGHGLVCSGSPLLERVNQSLGRESGWCTIQMRDPALWQSLRVMMSHCLVTSRVCLRLWLLQTCSLCSFRRKLNLILYAQPVQFSSSASLCFPLLGVLLTLEVDCEFQVKALTFMLRMLSTLKQHC